MNSWLATTIKGLGKSGFNQLLNALLLRIPIVILGDQEREANLFIVNLAKMVPHRQQVIFWSDFVTAQEAQALFENEQQNHENKRVIILCNSNVVCQAIQKMTNYKAWAMAFIPKSKDEINQVFDKLQSTSTTFLVVSLTGRRYRVQVYGDPANNLKFKFENRIVNKVIEEANISITRLSRLITKKVGKNSLSKQLLSSVVNFETENLPNLTLKKRLFPL